MRRLIVVGIGLGIGVLIGVLMLTSGEQPWLIGVGVGTCLLAAIVVSWLVPGEGRVVSGVVRWNGAEHRALIVPMSRLTVSTVYLVLGATIAGFIFIGAMAFIQYSTEPWVHRLLLAGLALFVVAVSIVPLVSPHHLALLRDGILLRMGPRSRFVPWATVASVGLRKDSAAFGTDRLVVGAYAGNRIRADQIVRLGAGHGLTVPLMVLDVNRAEVIATVHSIWRDPRRAERGGIPGVPQAPVAPHETLREALRLAADGGAEFVVFNADERRNYYVQVSVGPAGLLEAEAVSNAFLDADSRLGDREISRLIDLGWAAPRHDGENFTLELRVGSDDELDRAAEIVLETLRDVYRLPVARPPSVVLG